MTRIFYSWQSDLPNPTNRTFIEKALERAAKAIRDDESIEVQPVIDRDTAGVPGSPAIAETIFDKIDGAGAFVADVSIIGSAGGRPTPNPNVLIELGYAKKSLGLDRVIMVMNEAFGKVEDLPFDLRPRRVLTYRAEEAETDRSAARNNLQSRLEATLREVLASIKPPPPIPAPSAGDKVIEAVENERGNQVSLIRPYMKQLAQDVAAKKPPAAEVRVKEGYEALTNALKDSVPIVAEFSRVCEAVATRAGDKAAVALYKGLEGILEGYNFPAGKGGTVYLQDYDFHKFLGHECMVTLFALLLREERWDTIAALLQEGIQVTNSPQYRTESMSFEYASSSGLLWDAARQKLRLGRALPQSDLLVERHSNGALSDLVPKDEFMEADFFLFLRSVLSPEQEPHYYWVPWSCNHLRHAPRYLVSASRNRGLQALLKAFDIADAAVLRSRLADRAPKLFRQAFGVTVFADPLDGFDVSSIGSRP